MSEKSEKHLHEQLTKIEKLAEQIRTQRGYTKDGRLLNILAELIKEQVSDANSSTATRTLR